MTRVHLVSTPAVLALLIAACVCPGAFAATTITTPGETFVIPFHIENWNGTALPVRVLVTDLPSSFQPRIYINGSETETFTVPPGSVIGGTARIRSPLLLREMNVTGNITFDHQGHLWRAPFNVSVIIPVVELSALAPAIEGNTAILSGTIRNPSTASATNVTLSVSVGGRTVASQRYERVPPNGTLPFELRWPAGTGEQTALVKIESSNGVSLETSFEYSVPSKSAMTGDTVIVIGAVLALVFPIVVLAQMGIQRRKERRAQERRESEGAVSTSMLKLEEEP